MKRVSLVVGVLMAITSAAWAAEVGYIEDFSLAIDREAALKQLIPGTEDFYYYTCLNEQNLGHLDKVDDVLKAWIARTNRTARVLEIENRQALLRYAKQPRASLDFIIKRLDLQFNHQKDAQAAEQANLPTKLDPALLSAEMLAKRALERSPQTTNGFEPRALEALVAQDLPPDTRRNLLSRLTRPDVKGLVEAIAEDLKYKNSGGFGSLPIHRALVASQLEDLLKLEPNLLNQDPFVNAYLAKLQPNPDIDYAHDLTAREAHLAHLWEFVARLSSVHNSLKAHVLYHRLELDRSQGVWNKDVFLDYIKLPRQVSYINPTYLKSQENRTANPIADLSRSYPASLLPPVMTDEPLVRSYLAHFFVEAKDYKEYEPFIRDTYLKEVFAETKIVNGIGNMESWYAMVSPDFYQALKDRVDLDFDDARKEVYAADEAVALDVYVKNVKDLIVRVYEINPINYYRVHNRPVDLQMDLDGLVASEEQTFKYTEPPLTRVKRHYELKSLGKRGIYIVEFIGNGKSSRALVQKGQLKTLVRTGVAGHVFTILDESNKRVPTATLWLAGHEYTPGKDGLITVPFTHNPTMQPIILCQGDFATLASFQHEREEYHLAAGFFVDRESLLRRKTATVVIRPVLRVSGHPAPVSLLEDVTLVITAVDRENVSTTKEVRDLKLLDDRETTYEFQVPDNLKAVSFVLRGQVKNLSESKKDDVADGLTLPLNGIDQTSQVEDIHLLRAAGGYAVDVLGKTGEPKADRAVNFELKHLNFTETVHVSLRTDAGGRIVLGDLKDIDWIKATDVTDNSVRMWGLLADRCTNATVIHGKAGEAVYVPYMGKAAAVTPETFSLLERRGDTFIADRLKAMTLEDGYLVIRDLPRGNYDLLIKDSQTRIAVNLAEGELRDGYVLSAYRQLQVRNARPLQIASVESDAEAVTIRVANAGPDARVHVVAERYRPQDTLYFMFERVGLAAPVLAPSSALTPPPETRYAIGRSLSDEYRYILERKYAKKYVGNMLGRPGLLLNPWSPTETQTANEVLGVGAAGRAVAGLSGMGGSTNAITAGESALPQGMGSPNLDFLGEAAAVLVNLKPDEKGLVTIPRKALGPHSQVRILAVDSRGAAYREIALAEAKMPVLDLRLGQEALDPKTHFTEQKEIVALDKGKTFVVRDIGSSKLEIYDSLGSVYRLYATLSHNATLQEFNFILTWPTLKAEEKREKYTKYACHELNFYLSRKDPEFFTKVVQPYLKNKKDKTFMDRFLLGEDLKAYAQPWAYEQLNVAERILLAQRIAEEKARTARHVADLYDLIPPDVAQFNALFNAALQGGGLEANKGVTGVFRKTGAAQLQFAGGTFADMDGNGLLSEPGATMPSDAPARMAPAAAPAPPPMPSVAIRPMASTPARPVAANGAGGGRGGGGGGAGAAVARAPSADKAPGTKDDSYAAYEAEDLAAGYSRDLRNREDVRQLYRAMAKTEEWAENNYYHLPIASQNGGLVTVNAFWRDYAAHDPAKPFLSTNFIYANHSFTEMMLALALLDLPLEAAKHESAVKDATFTLAAGNPLIVVAREIKEAQAPEKKTPILVSQNFFRVDDRYRHEGNERFDKFVTDEFLIGVVYGSQVVVTNPTSSPQKLEVLLQVPRGAMPVANGLYTRSVPADLQPFSTQTLEYYFYFPLPGTFPQYPVQVSRNGALIGFADAVTLKAVTKLSKIDTTSWDYVAQNGAEEDVVQFLKDNNINRLNLDRIAWRMHDKAFFQQTIALLAARHVYQDTLWSYGLKHDDPSAVREFLKHQDGFVQQTGLAIESPLLVIDPVARRMYQHLEYSPLVNARAHKVGKERTILNDRLAAQYQAFLKVLTYRASLDDEDLMDVTYYLLLQDRVEEGLRFFARVKAEKLPERLQYDYFASYVAFYMEDVKAARKVADQYAAYPVERWRKIFAQVAGQLDEIEGKAGAVVDEKNREQLQGNLAATEPNFDLTLEAKTVTVAYQNLADLRINYYLMDVELLFSKNPFVQQVTGQFSFVKPNESAAVALKDKKGTYKFELPKAYQSANVMIEVVAGGVRKSQAYYANSMVVQTVENYGQLKVTDLKGKPLSKVYVKVYGRSGGAVKFYKDGYTDLRGQFDYTSVNTSELGGIEKFAILVLSETDGAVVREANPPKR